MIGANVIAGGRRRASGYTNTKSLFFNNSGNGSVEATNPLFASATKSGGKTVAMWVRLSGYTGGAVLMYAVSDTVIAFPGYFIFKVHNAASSGNQPRLLVQRRVESASFSPGTQIIGNTILSTSTKYLLGVSTNGSRHKLWINGVAETTFYSGSDTDANGDWFGNSVLTGTRTAYWGKSPGSSTNGYLDELMHFNSELTSAHFLELYNGGVYRDPQTLPTCPAPNNYWNVDNNSGLSLPAVVGSVPFTVIPVSGNPSVSTTVP